MSAPATDAAGTRLAFRILGPLEVLREGAPVEVGPRRHRALLALLLLSANRVVSADWLIEELWAGRPPAGAAKTLRSYVSRLRALLGEEVVRSRPPGYVLEVEPDVVDAGRFERLLGEGRMARARGDAAAAAACLREGLALWYGGALADLAEEPFAAVEAARLEELRLEAVEERIEADLECGRHDELVAELEALVVAQPLRERLWGQLMTALYRAGRQADALAAYQRARGLLADELGLETGVGLRALEQKILRHELEPAPAPAQAGRLPRGTVTLVFTDIERSTGLLQELGERYPPVLAEHRRALREAFARHGGVEVEVQGDGFFVVFASANEAAAAAGEAQEALAASPVRVRIGIHTGEPELTREGYVGLEVHRAARIMSAGHGGQVLLSQATRELLDATAAVRDLGEHRLKGLQEPQRLYQLGGDEFPPLRTLQRSNLPAQPTSFVGRERELDELIRLIPETPLVTLTGVGGSGKTRLALEAAGRVVSRFPDGVLLVELAGLTSPEYVPHAVAAQLEAQQRSERPVLEVLTDHLRSQALLLVLDNCEHLLDACAELAGRLLSTCPQLRILATSREPLGLPGEHVYRVPPLPVAEPGAAGADVAASEAVRLFLERASATGWEPDSSRETLATVAAICRDLDGLPLALELAAARAHVLTVEEIAARLGDRFRFLRYWRRSREPRHETLAATMAWSYDLLSEEERALLRRLSVFAGGFTLDAAAAVCLEHDSDAALALLTRLIDASLVVADPRHGKTRYHMLETVRHYAAQRLTEAGEGDETRSRHALYFAGDPEDAARFLPPDASTERFWRVNLEIENVRAALDWANETQSELELALAVLYQRANAVFPAEGRARLERALANPSPQRPQLRARALAATGGLALLQGDFTSARGSLEESLGLYRENNDQDGELVALARLQAVAAESGDELEALALASDVEALARRTGDSTRLSDTIRWRASRALAAGDRGRARQLLVESLALVRAGSDRADRGAVDLVSAEREGDIHSLLAIAEILDGQFEKAVAEAKAGLEQFSKVGEDYGGNWDSLDVLAAALAAAGDVMTGVRLYAAVRRGRETRGDAIPRVLSSLRELTHGRLEHALALPEFAGAAAEGRRMTMDEAVTVALTAAGRLTRGTNQVARPSPAL